MIPPALSSPSCGIFYSSASATPASVFPRLLRTYQHHLSKLNGGVKVNRERLVQDMVSGRQLADVEGDYPVGNADGRAVLQLPLNLPQGVDQDVTRRAVEPRGLGEGFEEVVDWEGQCHAGRLGEPAAAYPAWRTQVAPGVSCRTESLAGDVQLPRRPGGTYAFNGAAWNDAALLRGPSGYEPDASCSPAADAMPASAAPRHALSDVRSSGCSRRYVLPALD